MVEELGYFALSFGTPGLVSDGRIREAARLACGVGAGRLVGAAGEAPGCAGG
ncbi:hypothetical protein JOD54_005328 [Actinokineospora baliensis]|uniref:hypothetical protein n=1 Tax=Actinokineospora baliensis TaxID=547056 RepID=UPI00195DC6A9|nr:hypothetical protein [Actinokineospora baliensis]MBM7775124.1 hypothetical protein [Actinokineospora baliensis]